MMMEGSGGKGGNGGGGGGSDVDDDRSNGFPFIFTSMPLLKYRRW